MQKRTKIITAGAVVATVAAGGTTAAVASGSTGDDDGSEVPITGDALDRASAIALDATGGGTVTETEEGDEDSYYEVEVTRADGSQVDVQLNRDFELVRIEDEGPNDD